MALPTTGLLHRFTPYGSAITDGKATNVVDQVTGTYTLTDQANASQRPEVVNYGRHRAWKFSGAQALGLANAGSGGATFNRQNVAVYLIWANARYEQASTTVFPMSLGAGSNIYRPAFRSPPGNTLRQIPQVIREASSSYHPDQDATTTPAAPASMSPFVHWCKKTAAAMTVGVDDWSLTVAADSAATGTGCTIGALNVGATGGIDGYVFELLIYTAAEVTDAVHAQIMQYCNDQYGCGKAPSYTFYVVGDSIVSGDFPNLPAGKTHLDQWTTKLFVDLPGVKVCNFGFSGAQVGYANGATTHLQNFEARYTSRAVHGGQKVLLITGGSNDLYGTTGSDGSSAATLAGHVTEMATRWRAAGGHFVVACDVLPRTAIDVNRVAYNAQLRTLLSRGVIDWIIPFGDSPYFDALADASNTQYSRDGIHPTVMGHHELASIASVSLRQWSNRRKWPASAQRSSISAQ